MDSPHWVKGLVFVLFLAWFIDWEIQKVKKWVGELVYSKRPTADVRLGGFCDACGKPKSEGFADRPTCHKQFLDPTVCGTEWNNRMGTKDCA